MSGHDNDELLREALHISEERADQLAEVVEEQVGASGPLDEKLHFLNRRSGWTPDETAFAIFMFGYAINEVQMMNEALKAVKDVFEEMGANNLEI